MRATVELTATLRSNARELCMISRRHLLRVLTFFAIGNVLSENGDAQTDARAYNDAVYSSEPPHNEALRLVWEDQKNLIRELETEFAKDEQKKYKSYVSPQSRWWFDVDIRKWEVQRAGEPGTLDTTHEFYVWYSMNKAKAACWFVNTEKKTVTALLSC